MREVREVREVREAREADLRRPHGGVLVVMTLVKLPSLIPHNLQVLTVVVRDAKQPIDPGRHSMHQRVGEALGEIAPALEGRADRIELVAS